MPSSPNGHTRYGRARSRARRLTPAQYAASGMAVLRPVMGIRVIRPRAGVGKADVVRLHGAPGAGKPGGVVTGSRSCADVPTALRCWRAPICCGISPVMDGREDQRTDEALAPGLGELGWWRVLFRYWIRDHAWVRVFVWNFYKVDDDLYRSNHPGYWVLSRARALGVRSVFSLR